MSHFPITPWDDMSDPRVILRCDLYFGRKPTRTTVIRAKHANKLDAAKKWLKSSKTEGEALIQKRRPPEPNGMG